MSVQRHGRRIRVALVSSHPIQYQIPWFRALTEVPRIELKVFYTLLPNAQQQGIGFDVPFEWDVPLLEGYHWESFPSAMHRPKLAGFLGNRLRDVDDRISAWSPDVAVLTGWQNLALVQVLRAFGELGIPRLVRAEPNAMKPRRWPVRLIHRSLMSSFAGFLAIGKSNREFYLRNRVEPEKIFSCPYFVDNSRFLEEATRLSHRRAELRQQWGIDSGDTCFLFAGKLVAKKRCLDLIEAFKSAWVKMGNIHLLMVGDGKLRREAQRRAQRCSSSITFAGFLNQTEIAQAYVASDCLVLPSDYGETWGLVVNEAMVCGRPAIVSDRVGCGPDLVEEGVTGSVFCFGDTQALAKKLEEMAADKDGLRRMGNTARNRVLTGYSVEKAVEGTLTAIQTVLSR